MDKSQAFLLYQGLPYFSNEWVLSIKMSLLAADSLFNSRLIGATTRILCHEKFSVEAETEPQTAE